MVYPETELDLQNRLDAEIDAHRATKKERDELLKAMHEDSVYPHEEAEYISPEVKDIIIKNNETLKKSNNNLETAMDRVRHLEDNIERVEASVVALREEANGKRAELDRLTEEEIELEQEREDLKHEMHVTGEKIEEIQEETWERRRGLEDQIEILTDLRLRLSMSSPRQTSYEQL
jgi:archaellum component FlaC